MKEKLDFFVDVELVKKIVVKREKFKYNNELLYFRF